MLKLEKKQYWKIGLVTLLATFILLFIGVKVVLGNEVFIENIIAYTIFSVLVSIAASCLVFFKLKFAFAVYIMGLIVGFFEMYRAFLKDMSCWGDLAGIMSLLMWVIIGLVVGLVFQLGYYFSKKHINKN